VVAGFAGFLLLGLGLLGIIGPLVLLAGFGLLARDLRRPGATRPAEHAVAVAGRG
jgi:hypothetical protein